MLNLYPIANTFDLDRCDDMFLYNCGWGCAAFCEFRYDLRHFELKRINKIEYFLNNAKEINFDFDTERM